MGLSTLGGMLAAFREGKMGGPGGSVSVPVQVPRSSVTIAFNSAVKDRPYSLRSARDPGEIGPRPGGWDVDVRGRPRTFATAEAAERAARAAASAPLDITHVDLAPLRQLTPEQEAQAAQVRARAHDVTRVLEAAGGAVSVSSVAALGQVLSGQSGQSGAVGSAGSAGAGEFPSSLARDRSRSEAVAFDVARSRSERLQAAGRLGGMGALFGGGRSVEAVWPDVERALGPLSHSDRELFRRSWRAGSAARDEASR